jgi:hypothetical protein
VPDHPQTPQYFRERAAECQRLAEEIADPKNRETLLYVATRWRALADEDDPPKLSKADPPAALLPRSS